MRVKYQKMDYIPTIHKCSVCEAVKPVSDFCKNVTKKYGLDNRCKECKTVAAKEYRDRDKEKMKALKAASYLRTRKKVLESTRKYKEENKEVVKERNLRWYQNNKEKVYASCAKRRALKLSLLHPNRDDNKIKVIFKEARRISKMTGIPQAVDHILPLIFGGPHHEDNLQIISSTMNSNKREGLNFFHPKAKHWTEIPQHLLDWVSTENWLKIKTTLEKTL